MNDPEHPATEALQSIAGRVNELEHRLDRIELRLNPQTPPAPPQMPASAPPPFVPLPPEFQLEWPEPDPEPTPVPKMAQLAAVLASPEPPADPPFTPTPPPPGPHPEPDATPTETRPLLDLEALIGGKWALWAGSLCLFLSIASLLVYVSRKYPIPPLGRVMLGIGGGLLLLFASGYFRPRTRRWFTEGLAGAGLAITYLSLWAGAQYLHVLPWQPVYLTMGCLVGVGAAVAVAFDAFSLIALSTAGGFLTLWLFQTGASSASALAYLSAMALLNFAMTGISQFKRWENLTWGCLGGTTLCLSFWVSRVGVEPIRLPLFVFCTLFLLLFTAAACFYNVRHGEEASDGDLLLLVVTATQYSGIGFALVEPWTRAFPAAFPVAVALYYGLIGWYLRLTTANHQRLRFACTALTFLAGTIAVPVQFDRERLLLGWAAEAAALLYLANRAGSPRLRRSGQIVWLLSFVPLVDTIVNVLPEPQLIFLNHRALPVFGTVLISAWMAFDALRARVKADLPEDELAAWYVQYAILGLGYLLAQETFLGFKWAQAPAPHTWLPAALFTIAIELCAFATGLFWLGMRTRSVQIRGNAIIIGTLGVVLPFMFHLSFPNTGWTPFWNLRVLSFAAAPLMLMAVARMTARDTDTLTAPEREAFVYWPSTLSVLLLCGVSLEFYMGFEAWHDAARQVWQRDFAFYLELFWSLASVLNLLLGQGTEGRQLRVVSYGLTAAVTLVAFVACFDPTAQIPFFNLRGTTFAATTFLWLFTAFELRRRGDEVSDIEAQQPLNLALFAVVWAVFTSSMEIHSSCRYFAAALGPQWQTKSALILALWWLGSGIGCAAFGFARGRSDWRSGGYLLGGLGTATILVASGASSKLDWLPVLNLRTAAMAAAIAAFTWLWNALRHNADTVSEEERTVIPFAASAAVLLTGWLLTQEAFETCHFFRDAIGPFWERWAQLLISLSWCLYGAMLLAYGAGRHHKPARLMGLGLLALTTVKVFLFDLSFVGDSLRVLSLGGLGLSLIFISWLYSRFGVGEREDQAVDRKAAGRFEI